MTRVALLFAGQGAQVPGMGKDLAERYPELFEKTRVAADGLGVDLVKTCFEGPEERLTQTEFAQPGIVWTSWLALECLRHELPEFTFDLCAGLSLGEFAALAASESIGFPQAIELVRLRGRLMQEACDQTSGGMAAIIGLSREDTQAICDETGIELANLNCPGQIVISGVSEGIAKASELAKERGAKRAIPLNVAGAYHSKLMAEAGQRLGEALNAIPFKETQIPVISNVDAQPHGPVDSIRDKLTRQVTSPVLFEDSIRAMAQQGIDLFVELGPGRALSGFVKKVDRSLATLNVADGDSLDATVAALRART